MCVLQGVHATVSLQDFNVCAGYIKIIRPPLLLAADFIYDLHEELMEEYIPGGIDNCSGIIMDNTRANM